MRARTFLLKLSDEEVDRLDHCRARLSMTRAEYVRHCLKVESDRLYQPKLARTLGAVDDAFDAVKSLLKDGLRD